MKLCLDTTINKIIKLVVTASNARNKPCTEEQAREICAYIISLNFPICMESLIDQLLDTL